MTEHPVLCWRCGKAVVTDREPLRREETCVGCDADLHVCRMCEFYNPAVSDGCDEPVAAAVINKERANFCDYLRLSRHAFKPANDDATAKAQAELDALFGATTPPASTEPAANRAELERLFGLGNKED
ncbi:MAG: hypothetical protein ACPHUF_05870 [Gammaproteobacteria bacterium]